MVRVNAAVGFEIHFHRNRCDMARIAIGTARTGFLATLTALLLCSSSHAMEFNNTHTPEVHIPTPQVRTPHTPEIRTPNIHTPDAASRIGDITAQDLQKKKGSKDGASARLKGGGTNRLKSISAGEGRNKQVKQGTGEDAPNVTNDKTVIGTDAGNGYGSVNVPGVNNGSNGPQVNLPGGTSQQDAPGTVPGFDTTHAGTNIPGTVNNQHTSDDAFNAVAKQAKEDQQLLNQASQGPTTNVPGGATPESMVSDKTDNSKGKNNSSGGTGNNGTNTSANNTSNSGNSGSSSNSSSSSTSNSNGGSSGGSNGANNGPQGNGTNNGYPAGQNYGSHDGINYGTPTGNSGPVSKETNYSKAAIAEGAGEVLGGKLKPGGPKMTPSDDSSGAVSANTPLDPNSAVARKNFGGGTDNNDTSSSSQSNVIAPGSAYAKRNDGGGGNDGGENDVSKIGGTLATGSALAKKDYGDGGSSDTRGGGGTTSIQGGLKVGTGGSDPHQSGAGVSSGSAANRQ